MSVTRNRAKSIFLDAVENCPPERWDAFLVEACGGDADLRRRVRVLLDAHLGADSLIDQPGPAAAATVGWPLTEGPGTVIGPHKLLEVIGEGGMGVVYMADQTQPVRRKVALKIIKPGMDTRQVIVRFEAERQALAMMDHPHIAWVYDAGATESGRPYFVMELVRGIPITEYCDQHRLPIAERLGLFMQVCPAVQHAHLKGIIHRDLKPTNVLVTSLDGAPLPKVIDFGIAKATGPSLTDKTLFTGFAQLIGTPLYRSPEQAELSAVDVDTRSDIYSLGVLLYELLTGTTPFDQDTFRTAALDEVRRIIREQEPPRPSTRLSGLGATVTTVSANRQTGACKLNRSLRGELDWIVMKALEKDRRRRYETASGLARDVERYLAGEPVEAGPPSAWYRFRKFARRNRMVLTTTVFVALALIAGTTVSVWQALLARRARTDAIVQRDRAKNAEADAITQRDRAEANFRLARQAVDQMLTEVAEESLASVQQMTPVRQALLEKALSFYQEFLRTPGQDPAIRLENAGAYSRVGNIHTQLGQHARAQSAYEQSIALLTRLEAERPSDLPIQLELARSYTELGQSQAVTNRIPEAERSSLRAIDIGEKLVGQDPDREEGRKELAASYGPRHKILLDRGQLDEAERAGLRAASILEKLATEFPDNPDYQSGLGNLLNNLAVIPMQRGRPDQARPLLERADAHHQQALKIDPQKLKYRSFSNPTQSRMGVALCMLSQHAEAAKVLRQAVSLGEQIAADFPQVVRYQVAVAKEHLNLGIALKDSGKGSEAEQEYRRGLARLEPLVALHPKRPDYRRDVARAYSNLGELLTHLGRCRDAKDAYQRGLEHAEALAKAHPDRPDFRREPAHLRYALSSLLAQCHEPQGFDPTRAAELAEKAIELVPTNGDYWLALGIARYRAGDWRAAVRALVKSRELHNSSEIGDQLYLAMAHWQLGERDQARSWYDRASSWMEQNELKNKQLLRLRNEAAALLGLAGQSNSLSKKEGTPAKPSKP